MSTSLRLTVRDLECLPDVEGTRYELIDGDLHVSKSPSWHHQFTTLRIGSEFVIWDPQSLRGVVLPAPGIIFSDDNSVIPDLVWISRSRARIGIDEAGHLTVAPDLVIEVLSPGPNNERRDRELKVTLYSRRGVAEYWIVDWQRRLVEIYRRSNAALELVATLFGDDVLTSPLLPGFGCPLPRLWAPEL
jgi:Uma2 family endonuclease